MSNKSPGFERKPDYPLSIQEQTVSSGNVSGKTRGSTSPWMTESTYDPVFYIQKGMSGELLEQQTTRPLPLQGRRFYWSIVQRCDGGQCRLGLRETLRRVTEIAGALAFYASKVDALNSTLTEAEMSSESCKRLISKGWPTITVRTDRNIRSVCWPNYGHFCQLVRSASWIASGTGISTRRCRIAR